jgi:hypothetical protein
MKTNLGIREAGSVLVISLLFLITLVSAQPPVTTVQQFPEGYTIVEINYQTLEVGKDFYYFFYLYNTSSGLKIDNTTVVCNFHMTDSQGNLLINEAEVYQPNGYWYTIINGSYINETGYYYYGVDCSDGLSGALSGVFEVTYTGKDFTTPKAILYIGLLGIMLFILFSTFFGMAYLPASNERDEEGRILSINYLKYLRLPLWIFAYFLFSVIVFLSSNIAIAYLEEQMFGNLLFSIFTILLALSPIIIIITLISFFVKFFHDKEFRRMLNRGVFPQGNL